MSRVKISPGAYIGSTELNRFQQFIKDDAASALFKMMVKTYGFDPAVEVNAIGPMYVGYIGPGVLRMRPGQAVDSDLNMITVREDHDFRVPLTSSPNSYRYVLVSYDTTNTEVGLLSVTEDGNMLGSGTKFTETLRGFPGEPTSVRFTNGKRNLGEYPVSEVLSDDLCILNAIGLYPESNMNYEVIGAFPSDSYVSRDRRKIYEHDHFKLEIYPFLPVDVDKRIPVCRLAYDANGDLQGVKDLRGDYKVTFR